MPAPISTDLRIVGAVERGSSIRAAARRFREHVSRDQADAGARDRHRRTRALRQAPAPVLEPPRSRPQKVSTSAKQASRLGQTAPNK
jgi:hypothetical protein